MKDKHVCIKNIYYMLSYAFASLSRSNCEDIAVEAFDNIHNLFAAILGKGIGQQLKQGLYREYLNKVEDTAAMRGKINMPETLRKKIARQQVLTCEYDELSENNMLNQILKTTVMILLRHSKVDAKYKNALKTEMLYFSDVDTLDPADIKWPSIRFMRSNQTYRMLVGICQLILQGMLMTTDSGEYKLASFIDDQRMNGCTKSLYWNTISRNSLCSMPARHKFGGPWMTAWLQCCLLCKAISCFHMAKRC